jgi:hypothetical protein
MLVSRSYLLLCQFFTSPYFSLVLAFSLAPDSSFLIVFTYYLTSCHFRVWFSFSHRPNYVLRIIINSSLLRNIVPFFPLREFFHLILTSLGFLLNRLYCARAVTRGNLYISHGFYTHSFIISTR